MYKSDADRMQKIFEKLEILESDLDRQNYRQIYIRFTLHILIKQKQTLYILLIMRINAMNHNEKHVHFTRMHFGRQAKMA